MNPSGPGTGPAGRRLLSALDRLDDPVRAVPNSRGNYQLEGHGKAFKWGTIARLEDVGLISVAEDGDVLILRFTAAGRGLLGA